MTAPTSVIRTACWRAASAAGYPERGAALDAAARAALAALPPRALTLRLAEELILAARAAHRRGQEARQERRTRRGPPPRAPRLAPLARCRSAAQLRAALEARAEADLQRLTGADVVRAARPLPADAPAGTLEIGGPDGLRAPAAWTRTEKADWSRYSKSWHRAHGPARSVVARLTLDVAAWRRLPAEVRVAGGLVTLEAQPVGWATLPGTAVCGPVYSAAWLVPGRGKHASVERGVLWISSLGPIHAATLAEAHTLASARHAAEERAQARAQRAADRAAALAARTPEQAAAAAARSERARARRVAEGRAVAWWCGADPAALPEATAEELGALARRPGWADRTVTLDASARAGNCRAGTRAWALRAGFDAEGAPVRSVLAAALTADDEVDRAVAACRAALRQEEVARVR